jgi:hypothetical protein
MATILQNHYVLAVHDVRVSSEFFVSLGFRIVSEPPGWVFVEKDNCMIMLGECTGSIPATKLGDHSYFSYLRVDDARGYYDEVRAKGVRITSPIADKPWGMREFGVESPEGHRIMVGQLLGESR